MANKRLSKQCNTMRSQLGGVWTRQKIERGMFSAHLEKHFELRHNSFLGTVHFELCTQFCTEKEREIGEDGGDIISQLALVPFFVRRQRT
jgi:hypothetical protein